MDEAHPFPYFLSPIVRLTGNDGDPNAGPKFQDSLEEAAQYFLLETNFSKEFFEDYLQEALQPEFLSLYEEVLHDNSSNDDKLNESSEQPTIPAIAALTTAATPEVPIDVPDDSIEEPPLAQQNAETLELKEENIEEMSNWILEGVLESEVDERTIIVMWDVLQDDARHLSDKKLNKMNQNAKQLAMDSKMKRALLNQLTNQTTTNSAEALLNSAKLESVLYELHQLIYDKKLSENEALNRFQDNLIGQMLAQSVVEDSYQHLSDQLKNLEEKELGIADENQNALNVPDPSTEVANEPVANATENEPVP